MRVAQACDARLDLGFPMLVDTIDDAVGARYSGMPSRLYLIDGDGKVAYKSGRGPFGFKPAELEHSLVLLLQHEGPSGRRTATARPVAARPRGGSGRAGRPLNAGRGTAPCDRDAAPGSPGPQSVPDSQGPSDIPEGDDPCGI